MERALRVAKQTQLRFNAFQPLAQQAQEDESVHDKFNFSFLQLRERYKGFLELFRDVGEDDSSEWSALAALEIELDLQFCEFGAIHTRIARLQSSSESHPVPTEGNVLCRTGSNQSLNTERSGEGDVVRSHVRLPKIALPSFDGTLKKWPAYYDLYTTLIHNNTNLSEVEKFQYLLSTLSMEPLSIVKHLPILGENYALAFQSLVERYQNQRLLATSYWQSLAFADKVNGDSFIQLRRLLNTFQENAIALEQFPNVTLWNLTLFNWLMSKLDVHTKRRFELRVANLEFPTYTNLVSFLSDQCKALETSSLGTPEHNQVGHKSSTNKSPLPESKQTRRAHQSLITQEAPSAQKPRCMQCKGASHPLYSCASFLKLTPHKRHAVARSSHLCFNCLSSSHAVNACPSTNRCRHCQNLHHSLLHFATEGASASSVDTGSKSLPVKAPAVPEVVPTSMSYMTSSKDATHAVVLATAIVEVVDKWGNSLTVRALCDSGSQSCFITDKCRKQLGLSVNRAVSAILGIGQTTVHNSPGQVSCSIRPVGRESPLLECNAIVLPTICNALPGTAVQPSQAHENLKLADPQWYTPAPIDMLLGAHVFGQIIREGFIPGSQDRPAAVNTALGWILFGNTIAPQTSSTQSFFVSTDLELHQTLRDFWEVEEVPKTTLPSAEDLAAETLFAETHTREPAGRFGVCLPFRDRTSQVRFTGSMSIADRRLASLERRLSSSSALCGLYHAFMKDYLDLGHMSMVSQAQLRPNSYFIPHHCVLKDTKLRVVFDASCQTQEGVSLNDTLMVGPKLQNDIVSVLLRFRIPYFVFSCDVRQMFRNILVHDSDRDFQLIRWRFSQLEPIQTYRLNTVTYGVTCSPYLAIRCLLQLAVEGTTKFPMAAQAIRQNLYVDDFVCGADDIDSTLTLRDQLIQLLSLGCFELRKWMANHTKILEGITPEHCQSGNATFDSPLDHIAKVLGILWMASEDSFSFVVTPSSSVCTKRNILSEIARIYDPIGFLCPLNLWAKRLIQYLWSLGVGWDDPPPKDVSDQWSAYQESLPVLSQLRVPRCLKPHKFDSCQLHVFCDASEKGYACVAYFRFTEPSGLVHVSFIMAKSKVAPLKVLSIPRLELCAAVLLAKLVAYIHHICQGQLEIDQTYAWSDSKVALSWIKSLPHKWKTFVANRVTYIQERVPPNCWHYVHTKENPADPASRGLLPQDLLSCSLWWAGPIWLKDDADSWSSPLTLASEVSAEPEVQLESKPLALAVQVPYSHFTSLLDSHSLLSTVQRIIAYCRRFVGRCRGSPMFSPTISKLELHEALMILVREVQGQVFAQELADLRDHGSSPKSLRKLSVFLDQHGIMRVGGRLRHAPLSFEAKHPALLPRHHRLTELIIKSTHIQGLHSGVNTTLYLIQQNFWVLSGRQAVRSWISKCNQCFRVRPTSVAPPMGDLPLPRVSQLKAFSHVGVDYGGPILITMLRRRGAKTQKAYLCLFVCFATKAIHVEIALDMSTDTFVAALRRFIARRGRCSTLYNDCGTNFVGASKELSAHMRLAAEAESIEWKFNPPSAPHFGGLWEGGIKSLKTHLNRVIGTQILTYEELVTLCCQVEALLNSRPLCPMSSDPNDLATLTPGHFLTMEPLTAAPDPDVTSLKLSHLSRWQLIQRLHHDFWNRWKDEYLHTLHQRSKWHSDSRLDSIDIGTLVLLKDEQSAPLHWRLARIVQLHPGRDGVARVATVRTPTGTFKRPVVKLCPLPTQ